MHIIVLDNTWHFALDNQKKSGVSKDGWFTMSKTRRVKIL